MSALPPIADIRQRIEHVCFVPLADISPQSSEGPTAYAVPMSLIPYQHSRAPEVQTTGETTPVQQIVYAESLTTSGGSSSA
jgi:hypothetical protein